MVSQHQTALHVNVEAGIKSGSSKHHPCRVNSNRVAEQELSDSHDLTPPDGPNDQTALH